MLCEDKENGFEFFELTERFHALNGMSCIKNSLQQYAMNFVQKTYDYTGFF